MAEGVWVPIAVALLMSTPLYHLIKSIIKSFGAKDKRERDAWYQRDTHRRRADIMHEALTIQRTWCHERCGVHYDDMPPFPGRDEKEK